MSDNPFIEVFGGPHDGIYLPVIGTPDQDIALNHPETPSSHIYVLDLTSGEPRYIHAGPKPRPTTHIAF